MTLFQQMVSKVTSSNHYNKMMRFVKPLEEHFGINHFWYYRVTNTGLYSYVGTHAKWNEKCLGERDDMLKGPYLRHPDTLTSGVSLMKNSSGPTFNEIITTASEDFGINFNLHLLKKTNEGAEGFGFATHQNLHVNDEYLINELPLLTKFIKQFRQENSKIFYLIHDNPIDLNQIMGSAFYESNQPLTFPKKSKNREEFIRKLGDYDEMMALTPQEKLIFMELANGFSAPYIANKLFLSTRTIENYIANIKLKLLVDTKMELIEMSKEFSSLQKLNLNF
jgi:DNA-binding CsgD family transcriptional regulator